MKVIGLLARWGLVLLLLPLLGHAAEEAEVAESKAITVKDFFRTAEISRPRLSPDGELYAYEAYRKVMVGSAEIKPQSVFEVRSDLWISGLKWVNENVILIEVHFSSNNSTSFNFLKVAKNKEGNAYELVESGQLDTDGYLVDPLEDEPGHVLFAEYKADDDGRYYADVYYAEMFGKDRVQLRRKSRINRQSNSGEIITWLTDEQGQLTVGISFEDEVATIWQRKGSSGRLKEIWTAPEKARLIPYSLTKDMQRIWVLTDFANDKLVARAFDLKTRQFQDVVYARESVDLSGMLINPETHEPMAFSYMDKGQLTYEFINTENESAFSYVSEQVSGQSFAITDASVDLQYSLIIAWSEANPGQLYLCNNSARSCQKLGSLFPWLDDVSLASVKPFQIKTDDGIQVESFLTLPNTYSAQSATPLIVMPHGGPIGVRDNGHFSSDTQWLAFNGFAVLQINYRGSGGYGKTFKAQGMQQWGRAIEDDIEGALAFALKQYPGLNKDKVCTFGGSYGGYSALMGIVRSPKLYQCAASFAGVTDLPLMFNRSRIKNDEDLVHRMKEIIGDPETQKQELIDYSPVYQYEKMTRPIFLAHGTIDKRVDVEHGWRLHTLLDIAGIEHKWLAMDDIGHGFDNLDEVEQLYDQLMPFFEEHLKASVPVKNK